MDIYTFVVLGMIVGYLIGSIPFGLIIGKLFYKIDIRNYGSKNLGATNTARTLGAKAGICVLILDMLKGGLPAFLMYKISESYLIINFPDQVCYLAIVYCVTGLFAALGHCHPLFLGFNGGKGVATILGFIAFMNYKLLITIIITFMIVILLSRIVSLGSITCAIVVTILQFIPFFKDCYIFTNNDLSCRLTSFIYHLVLLTMAALLIYRHLANIERLLKKQEKKFSIEKVNLKK
ncbi:MAG: glycerol-3-phosphate 1-O-acyltransferase PlsY [Erysipelotrichaceae bacterium]|nr:glycerol-3-phosphate 1-O-acyltransferase PlsY [Erysipelotrichaceae bacterium]